MCSVYPRSSFCCCCGMRGPERVYPLDATIPPRLTHNILFRGCDSPSTIYFSSSGTHSSRHESFLTVRSIFQCILFLLVSPPLPPLHKQCPPSPEPPWIRDLSPSGAQNQPAGLQEKHNHKHNGAVSVSMSYSDFLHQNFGDGEGKDNRRMKDIRDEKKVCIIGN